MMSCAISGYIGAPLEITSQHLMPHYDIYPIFFQPSSPTLFSLHKCLHLCSHHTSLVQGRSGVFALTRHFHGIIHSFISLLLRSIIVGFHPNYNLFPNDKQYEIAKAPSTILEHGCQIYIPGTGLVYLLEIVVKKTRKSRG